jgi:hypothetical protein
MFWARCFLTSSQLLWGDVNPSGLADPAEQDRSATGAWETPVAVDGSADREPHAIVNGSLRVVSWRPFPLTNVSV